MPLAAEIDPALTQAAMMSDALGAALHEIVGQVHHLAEAMIHDRKTAVGAEHAQAVRHVVQGGIELAGQRRLALARHQRLHEYSVQIGRDLHDGHKKCGAHDRHRHVIGCATQRQRDHSWTEGKRNLQLEYPLPSIGPARTARHDPGGDGQTNHVGHGVVTAQQSGRTPYAERSGLDHRPDLIALLPPRSFIGSQGRFARLVPLQVERADGAGDDEKRDTRPDQSFSRLQRGHGCRDGAEDETRKQRTGCFEQRIDQRRANRRRHPLIGLSALVRQLHLGFARPVRSA